MENGRRERSVGFRLCAPVWFTLRYPGAFASDDDQIFRKEVSFEKGGFAPRSNHARMCLSTVIRVSGNEQETVMKNVCAIELKDGAIVLTDIMGRTATVEGALQSLDFVNNIVRVAAAG